MLARSMITKQVLLQNSTPLFCVRSRRSRMASVISFLRGSTSLRIAVPCCSCCPTPACKYAEKMLSMLKYAKGWVLLLHWRNTLFVLGRLPLLQGRQERV